MDHADLIAEHSTIEQMTAAERIALARYAPTFSSTIVYQIASPNLKLMNRLWVFNFFVMRYICSLFAMNELRGGC